MRKSVIIVIACLYVVSIVVVTFFGMNASFDQFKVYMTSIEITNEGIEKVGDNKILTIDFDEEKAQADGYISIFISYDIKPDDATRPDMVKFTLSNEKYTDDEGNEILCAVVSTNGEVVFYQKRTVRLTIYTQDGSNLSDSILIRCR